jgi:hypothetical protein
MKLPGNLSKLFSAKKKSQDLFLTLVLDADHVAGCCWYIGPKSEPEMLHAVVRRISVDNWEERTIAADEIITALEEKTGTENIHKVVFGLPAAFLTPEGNIKSEIRPELKKMAGNLEISPIGFVPIHQAIVHKLKREEGVPPSVILLGLAGDTLTLSLYKVGILSGITSCYYDPNILQNIENILKQFVDIEVLPSRILLYGVDSGKLEFLKNDMTRYPWPTKVNFLHFPKIEILPPEESVTCVSLAGAFEMANSMHQDDPESEVTQTNSDSIDTKTIETETDKNKVGKDTSSDKEDEVDEISEKKPKLNSDQNENELKIEKESIDETENEEIEGQVANEIDKEEDEKEAETESESNVSFVSPETFGFTPGIDVTVQTQKSKSENEHKSEFDKNKINEEKEDKSVNKLSTITNIFRNIKIPHFSFPFQIPLKGGLSAKAPFIVAISVLILAGLIWLILFSLPRATVTIVVSPKQIQQTVSLNILPDAVSVSADTNSIPGKKLEKQMSGDKVIPVTGKKKVGEPAKGTVTIYNKSLDSRTFKKGTIISSGGIQFTLDNDVSIASASESIGSLTFGKTDAPVTASQIGTAGNISSGNDFEFKDYSSSIVTARNDAVFSGGTSRDVKVVSRADMDELVSAVSKDLVDSAKQGLTSSVSGSQKLIVETVKTSVVDKKFTEELDQETDKLHGTVTISVTGVAYDEADLKLIWKASAAKNVPPGYVLSEERLNLTVSKVQVKKDGKINAELAMSGYAVPTLDPDSLKTKITGQSISKASEIIKLTPGVFDIRYAWKFALLKNKLPIQKNHITIAVTVE